MELTESWRAVMPSHLLDRYEFAETRNAATLIASTHPEEFEQLCAVLSHFSFDVDRIVRPGGSKHLISLELDEAFRELGWREGRYDQELTTTLTLEPYRAAGETTRYRRVSQNEYGGHKIDNVRGRIGLDVEWNPKDGNLDRDFGNFRALYDGGALDAGIILTRTVTGMRELWIETIARSKEIASGAGWSEDWRRRLTKTPNDPLGTSTTSNFEKLVPRVKRGDGGGCPILAIAITDRLYRWPDDLDSAIVELANSVGAGETPERLGHRMGLVHSPSIAPELLTDDDSDN
ncbi:restriction endonuclease [Microbacterium sp. CnD16-F]|uniref:BglII/BstYI family type II restriction endonuclease n=1 Tax=Actinomycetes TaxID=1760 RepID=UPI0020969FE0|nr:BglII/BstYI family type II restriction endonuclease [Microbacterium sp. CnD16-F]MCO7203297.1 restriction endonuclease [Microbacterium sp. CnD16-F]